MITGLAIVGGPPGWIGVRCESEAMALWLLRAIVVENVMARREGAVLYLPAGPAFAVEGEIRNVVTALAKTHHYWTQHAAAPAAPPSAPPRPPPPGHASGGAESPRSFPLPLWAG